MLTQRQKQTLDFIVAYQERKTGIRRAPVGHPNACKQNELAITDAGRKILRAHPTDGGGA